LPGSCIFAAFEKSDSTLKALKPFEIAFVGLSGGVHEFRFEIGDDFFECFEESEIIKANLQATLFLHKKNNMLDLRFEVSGNAELTCDLCMEAYMQPIQVNKEMFVKYGEHREELSDEILIIPHTESHLDVSQYFYEFIALSLPIRHVHPGGSKPEDNCDEQSLKEIQKYLVNKANDEFNNDEKPTDSRWDALKNLKFN
jgi:uncharacterized metal-binding protein YceD (DUF177 family)